VLLAGAGAAVAGTSGDVFEPPVFAVLATCAGAIVAALLVPRRARAAAAIVAAAAAGAAAGHVLSRAGLPRIHDFDHLWGIWAYGRSIEAGSWYPLWIPYLGAGMPLFQFYGPLNFLMALPGVLAGLAPVGAFKLELFQGHVLSALSFLAAARLLGAGWRGSLVGAVAGAFAPWRLAVFDYRGALGEANAFLFLPVVAAAALRTAREGRPRHAAILAGSAAGLILTHLLSLFTLAVTLVPALAAGALSASPEMLSRGRRLGSLAAALLAAALLTAWWWLPAAVEGTHTSVGDRSSASRYFRYEEHGVALTAPFERRLWDRSRISLPESYTGGRGAGELPMPFYAGSVLLIAGLAAPFWSRRSGTGGLALGAGLALALATAPAAHLLAGVPGFAQLYFPWRFLTPASVLAALALAVAADRREASSGFRASAFFFAALTVCLVWDAAPYTGAPDRIPPHDGIVHWVARGGGEGHWANSMEAVPVAPPAGAEPHRVWDLKLPPSRYDATIDAVYYVYPEWVTPVLYRSYWLSSDPAVIARAGVSLMFDEGRRDPRRLPARAYAELVQVGRPALPVPPERLSRLPGRIEVQVEVPQGGGRLVILEQAFPGWRATIDGRSAGVPEEDGGFMSVDLPAGAHDVVLTYGLRTPARIAGLLTTLLAASLSGLSLLRFPRGNGSVRSPQK
jgi:hypothetical protein